MTALIMMSMIMVMTIRRLLVMLYLMVFVLVVTIVVLIAKLIRGAVVKEHITLSFVVTLFCPHFVPSRAGSLFV